jgi:hypothetical protein
LYSTLDYESQEEFEKNYESKSKVAVTLQLTKGSLLPIILSELSEVGSMKNSPPLTDAERMNRAVLCNLETQL